MSGQGVTIAVIEKKNFFFSGNEEIQKWDVKGSSDQEVETTWNGNSYQTSE